MESTINKRFKKFIKYKNIDKQELANMLHIAESTLYSKINGTRSIDTDTICIMIRTYSDLSPEWLLLGEGEMIKDRQQNSAPSSDAMDAMKDRHIAELEKHIQDLQRLVDMQEGIINSQRLLH